MYPDILNNNNMQYAKKYPAKVSLNCNSADSPRAT